MAEVANLNQIADIAQQVLESLCGWFEQIDKEDFDNPEQKEQNFEENAVPAIETIGKNWPKRETFLPWLSEPKKEIRSFQGYLLLGIYFGIRSKARMKSTELPM